MAEQAKLAGAENLPEKPNFMLVIKLLHQVTAKVLSFTVFYH